MNIEPLKQLGLSEGEISVYLANLKIGLTTAGPIIKESQLQSSAVYHILDSLIEKGIIAYETKNKIKYFYPISPERLLDLAEQKKEEIEKNKLNIQELIPSLLSIQNKLKKPSQETLIFEGWKGVLSAFKEAYSQLKPGTEIYAYTITKEFGGAEVKQVQWLINKNIELRTNMNKKLKDKIHTKIISEKGSVIGEAHAKAPFTEVKFIENPQTSPAVINIYGDVTVIALWLKNPIAFYINSKEVSTSFKNNFNLIWKNAK